jgi:hypothetical protein
LSVMRTIVSADEFDHQQVLSCLLGMGIAYEQ